MLLSHDCRRKVTSTSVIDERHFGNGDSLRPRLLMDGTVTLRLRLRMYGNGRQRSLWLLIDGTLKMVVTLDLGC